MIDLSKLRPGDCLLYSRTPFLKSRLGWFFGLVINVKTWSRFSHVEVYAGNGQSFASRDGQGVGLYPFRASELLKVRRPDPEKYTHSRSVRWFETVDGQKYDWLGLLCFTLAVERGSNGKMFCSEFATRWYRNAGLLVFNQEFNADRVSPAQFDQVPSPQLSTVRGWRK